MVSGQTVVLQNDTTPALHRNILQLFSSSAKQGHQLLGRGGGVGVGGDIQTIHTSTYTNSD